MPNKIKKSLFHSTFDVFISEVGKKVKKASGKDGIMNDEQDLNIHLDYIHYNPVKHGLVNAVKDWKYSSFHKYVRLGYYYIDWSYCAPELNFE